MQIRLSFWIMVKLWKGGTHEELTNLRGKYYHLVKNQLELGGN